MIQQVEIENRGSWGVSTASLVNVRSTSLVLRNANSRSY
jgi:hypothetical protein